MSLGEALEVDLGTPAEVRSCRKLMPKKPENEPDCRKIAAVKNNRGIVLLASFVPSADCNTSAEATTRVALKDSHNTCYKSIVVVASFGPQSGRTLSSQSTFMCSTTDPRMSCTLIRFWMLARLVGDARTCRITRPRRLLQLPSSER